ncbi:MAG: hypothetical protein C5B50_13160 [Verrucomicrobia bacterium]|nr:MAG: hypothetical protein C5B50_13160 [Verrucomicrobiota bacterium]
MKSSLILRSICSTFAMAAYLGFQATCAGFSLDGASQFAVLSQYANNMLNFNNGTITGDIGLGSPRQFTASNGSVVGNVRFSGASSTSGLTPNPTPGSGTGPFTVSGGGTVSGNVVANDAGVTSALNYVNSLSQTLGGESGTALTLTSSQTINASSGMLDGSGNEVFTAASVNLNNASVLTINGSASDYVVINVTDNNPAFNGSINLTGGITDDHVLFNMYGGNYTTHTGGPTLTISNNGQTANGTFLDPNGGMQMNHSVLDGRFFGGDVANQQIVSGGFITAPVPEPGTASFLAFGLLSLLIARRSRKQ